MPGKMGRPPLPEDRRRSVLFQMRLSPLEAEFIRRAARSLGRTGGRYVREAAMRAAARDLDADPP